MNDPWRDPRRVAGMRTGVAAARKVLEMTRDGDRYTVDGIEFIGWEAAIAYVLAQPEGEK